MRRISRRAKIREQAPTCADDLSAPADGELRKSIAAASPLQRLGTPDDIAEAVLFLTGSGRWANGQVIYLNGGAI
ncbi:SDR family oxidoreductase [Streptomyces sp. FXJ1.4098]|nr:SDR family oxidoreductase [Streptomyces sp. FXJ1.4098]